MSSLILGILAVLLPIIGALGTRAGMWQFTLGLLITPLGLILAVIGSLLGILAIMRVRKAGGRLVLPAHGAGLSLLVCFYLGAGMISSFGGAPIYNVSTDIEDPPRFTKAELLRGEDANPLHYDSDHIGPLQREAFPDVQPLTLDLPAEAVYERAKSALLGMGMEITREDPEQGEIEAIATTFWFGFKDDIIVRLREADGGTRMDVRSVSRVGVVDLGVNAERILKIIKRVMESD